MPAMDMKGMSIKSLFVLNMVLLIWLMIIGRSNGVQIKCKYNEYVGGTEDKRVCIPCKVCRKGYGLNHPCDNKQKFPPYDYTCIPCKNGTRFSQHTSSEQCLKCSDECYLEYNHVETSPCVPTHDRVCKCKSGFFTSKATGVCDQECCWCDPSHHDRDRVTKCWKEMNDTRKICYPPAKGDGRCTSPHTKSPTITGKITKPSFRTETRSPASARSTHTKPPITTTAVRTRNVSTIGTNSTTMKPHIVSSNTYLWYLFLLILLIAMIAAAVCYWLRRSYKQRNSTEDDGQSLNSNSSYTRVSTEDIGMMNQQNSPTYGSVNDTIETDFSKEGR